MGREYILANSEVDKMLYSAQFLAFRLGPFLDTDKIYDPRDISAQPLHVIKALRLPLRFH
jgi:hypothetical protein